MRRLKASASFEPAESPTNKDREDKAHGLSQTMEIELKLAFPPDAREAIAAHPLLAAGKLQGQPETLESTYFDTLGLELQARRIALRVRNTSRGKVQTVKCAATSSGGLSARPEWECPYGEAFDFSAVDDAATRRRLEEARGQLLPVFKTVFERRTWLLEPRPGVRILVMLDSGHVITAEAAAPISELELELVAGSADDLRSIAIQLAADLPLIPYDPSKAERGYRMFSGQALRPQKAGKSPVRPAMTPLEAFQALAEQGLHCWQANLHGALAENDPEFIHQFRVALRRLNTLLTVFAPALPADFADSWSESLKTLAGTTGELRDLDVMRENVLRPMLGRSPDPAHDQAVRRAIAACDAARAEADGAIDRLADGLPLLRFARDIAGLPNSDAPKSAARFAEKRLGRLYRKTLKRLKAARREPSPQNAHRLRIALKHLRYACEFFASIFDETAMLGYGKGLAALQDHFGSINDHYVALARLAQWSASDPTLLGASAYITAWHGKHLKRQIVAALELAEQALGQCEPWCGACERRGMSCKAKTH